MLIESTGYGNKQLIISSHMDNLLKLKVVSSVNDVKGIRQLYDKTEIHIRGLQALGVEAQQYGSLLVPGRERKHPPKPSPPTFNTMLAPEGQGIMYTFCKQSHKISRLCCYHQH